MSSTETLILMLLVSGFTVGFGHCIGMCGPIVVFLTLNLKGRSVLLSHLLYNSGRITTYALLGGLMGLTGSFTRLSSGMEIIQKWAMVFAGLLIVFMGLAMGGWIPISLIFGDWINPEGWISKLFKRYASPKTAVSYYPLGLLLGLLPCGPVYTALIAAARKGMETSSSVEGFAFGMTMMLAFGLGTVPALILVAKLADMGWIRSREVIYKIGAALMVLLGIYFVVKGLRY
jgi:sulfite exporter TauE/SafE